MKSLLSVAVAILVVSTSFSVPQLHAAFVSDVPTVFDIEPANGFLEALATDGETLYVGGTFTEIDGVARQGFAAFDIETQTLLPLDLELNGDVYTLLLDGTTLYVGGSFSDVNNGTSRSNLAAFDITTGIVTGFEPPEIDGSVGALLLDGTTLYVGGNFSCVGTYIESCDEADWRNNLAAFNTGTGELTPFDPNIGGRVDVLALDGDADILYVGGNFTTVNDGAVNRNYIAAFDTDTSIATGFDVGGVDDNVVGLLIVNNLLYISGNFTTVNAGIERNRIAVINRFDGFLAEGQATPFDANIDGGTASEMHLSEGVLYVVGGFSTVNGDVTRNSMAGFDDEGTVIDFDPDFNDNIISMTVDGDGNMYVAGGFTGVGEQSAGGIAYFEFVADETAPTIDTLAPADNAVDVGTDTDLVITFSETVVASSTGDIVVYTSGDVVVETISADDGQVTIDGDEVTIELSADLEYGTSYYVQIDTGAFEDIAGNPFAGITDTTTWNFTTVASDEGGDDDEESSDGGGGGSSSHRRMDSNIGNMRDPVILLMQQLIALLQQLLEQLIAEQQSQ